MPPRRQAGEAIRSQFHHFFANREIFGFAAGNNDCRVFFLIIYTTSSWLKLGVLSERSPCT